MKFTSKLLTLLMATLLVLTSSVSALSYNDNYFEQEDTIDSYFYYNAETNEFTELESFCEEKDIVFDSSLSPDSSIPPEIALEKFQAEEPIENENSNASTQSKDIYVIHASYGLTAKSGAFTCTFMLSTTRATKPLVDLSYSVYGYDGTAGYRLMCSGSASFRSALDWTKEYKSTFTGKTGYYYITYTIKDHTSGLTNSDTSATALLNRSGKQWVWQSESTADKTLGYPQLGLTKENIAPPNYDYRTFYFNTYEAKHGTVSNKNNYQVHHIRPRAYGGLHGYNNLIHLKTATHTAITAWWAGY